MEIIEDTACASPSHAIISFPAGVAEEEEKKKRDISTLSR
jgi:hypothetical protein